MNIIKTETIQLSKSEVTALNTVYVIMENICHETESPNTQATAQAITKAIDQFIDHADIEQSDD